MEKKLLVSIMMIVLVAAAQNWLEYLWSVEYECCSSKDTYSCCSAGGDLEMFVVPHIIKCTPTTVKKYLHTLISLARREKEGNLLLNQ